MPRSPARFPLTLALSLVVLAVAAPLRAETPAKAGESGTDQARALGREALAAFDAGDYPLAARRFRAALERFEFPTLRLYLARSLERQGLLVESTRQYEALIASPARPGEGEAGEAARAEARREASGVASRRAVLVVRGLPPGAQASIDGNPASAAELAAGRFVDPGMHVVSPPGATEPLAVRLAEGERRELSLAEGLPALPEAVPSALAIGDPPDVDVSSSSPGRFGPSAIVAAVATAAAAGGAIVTGLLALDRQADYEAANRRDSPDFSSRHDARSSARSMQWLNAAFVAATALGGGTTLYLYFSAPEPGSGAETATGTGAYVLVRGRL